MSRGGAPSSRKTPEEAGGGTPVWVWLVYGLGLLAGTILLGSILFSLGASLGEDTEVEYDVSVPALLLWGGIVLAALVVWLRRRRSR
ncbi:MAG TPA: hypothetical protein VNJ53_06650 [Gaiellaceae bacterium]|nr:hypothetical protein [Gaiellaceae bacterium]